MSRPLVEWLLVNPIEIPTDANVGADRTWRVLLALANRSDEFTGLIWASDRTQEKDTGLNRRSAVQPVRKALEQAGWLIDTGKRREKGVKVFELVIPGYVRPVSSGSAVLATENVDKSPSGSGSGSGSGSDSGSEGLAQTKQNRTSLSVSQKTESAHETDPVRAETERAVLVIEKRVEERKGREVGVAYLSHWRKEYEPIISQAIEQCPGKSADELAQWAYAKRHGQHLPDYREAPAPSKPAEPADEPPGEPEAMSDENRAKIRAIAQRARPRHQQDTQGDTQERVSTGQDAYTDIPTPPGSADSQLPDIAQVIKGLSKSYRR
jgi:hypothetical protein